VRAIISKYPKSGILNGIPLNSEPFDGQELPEFGVNLEVDISNLIDNVVIAPTRSSWFLDVIYDLCAKYGLPANIVTESELRADPVYGSIAK
jgi:hypothetical protein